METSILYHPVGNNGVPDLKDPVDDGETWAEGCLLRDDLSPIFVCYAVHDNLSA